MIGPLTYTLLLLSLHDGIQKELSAKTTQKSRTGPDQISMPMPPTAPEQRRSSSTSLKKVETDLLAFLKNGLADQAPPPRHHHHPPNEYGPERTEQLQKHQQQALMNQSPAILPPFTDLSRMQWAPSPAPPAPPPVPPQPPQVDHGLEFSLPDTELMQSQPNQKEPPASHPLIDLFKNALTDNDNSQQQQYVIQSPDLQRQQQQQHLHQHQHQHQQQQQQQQPGMSDDPGYRLLELLKRSTVDDKMGQHVPSPPMPPSSSGFGASPRQAHYNQQPQQIMSHPPMPAHPSSSSSTPNTLQHQHQHQQQQQPPIFLGKELTKAYQPNMPSVMDPRRNNQHQASPRNSASLLQALQGGMGGGPGGNSVSPSPSSSAVPNGLNPLLQQQQQGFTSASSTGALHGSPGPAFSSSTSRSSFSSATPLMVHQSLDLTQTELNKRLGGKQHKVLSKPEFIQQYLNMVQVKKQKLLYVYTLYSSPLPVE